MGQNRYKKTENRPNQTELVSVRFGLVCAQDREPIGWCFISIDWFGSVDFLSKTESKPTTNTPAESEETENPRTLEP